MTPDRVEMTVQEATDTVNEMQAITEDIERRFPQKWEHSKGFLQDVLAKAKSVLSTINSQQRITARQEQALRKWHAAIIKCRPSKSNPQTAAEDDHDRMTVDEAAGIVREMQEITEDIENRFPQKWDRSQEFLQDVLAKAKSVLSTINSKKSISAGQKGALRKWHAAFIKCRPSTSDWRTAAEDDHDRMTINEAADVVSEMEDIMREIESMFPVKWDYSQEFLESVMDKAESIMDTIYDKGYVTTGQEKVLRKWLAAFIKCHPERFD